MSSPEGRPPGDGAEQSNPSARAGIELPAAPQSVPVARAFVAETLKSWRCDDPGRVVGLLTSEIVTNAVRHALRAIWVEATVVGHSTVRIAATDDHPGVPVLRRSGLYEEGGRGMQLVASLASRWGVQRDGGHKVVWFEAPVVSLNHDGA